MTEPTPNADEAVGAKWLQSIGGVSSIIAAVLGFVGGVLASIFTGANI